MKFCPECNSMLYYVEEDGVLYEKCKACDFSMECQDRKIEKTVYKTKTIGGMENTNFFIHDLTLPRTIHKDCPNQECLSKKEPKLQEAVFYNDPETMKLVYICVVCNTEWKYA